MFEALTDLSPYSTPFESLADTFTGKVVYFFKLGLGRVFSKKGLHFFLVLISIIDRKSSPNMGIYIVLYYTPS